ncbi:MAG TPA: alpha/beta hydrolase [Acidimicrobiales bacterium]|nr:alpha/beta hydrolase [Acidimicrobiales bacterium]
MTEDEWSLTEADGTQVFGTRWAPKRPKAAVQIAHGWAEHRRRYARLAAQLCAAGYAVWADDHLGHGETGTRGGGLGDLGPRGMEGVTQAVLDVTRRIKRDEGRRPLCLLGHSWGSFIAQRLVREWGDEYDALVLTGTTRREPGGARRASAPDGVGRYDWLSRDAAEVAAYEADPWCGFENLSVRPADPGRAYLNAGRDEAVPDTLPVLILNGAEDVVGGEAGGRRLADAYSAAGLADVTLIAYPGGRHEVFNELNRDAVTADLVTWLDAHLA